MQKWEYKVVWKFRNYTQKNLSIFAGTEEWPVVSSWVTKMEDGTWKEVDFQSYLNQLGEQGWELASAYSESGNLGGFRTWPEGRPGLCVDVAGFDDTEKLIFKRPKG
jgi:hypothetical protein